MARSNLCSDPQLASQGTLAPASLGPYRPLLRMPPFRWGVPTGLAQRLCGSRAHLRGRPQPTGGSQAKKTHTHEHTPVGGENTRAHAHSAAGGDCGARTSLCPLRSGLLGGSPPRPLEGPLRPLQGGGIDRWKGR
eukprot:1182572-Prorocentrum_minimum.AAC.3